jgi:hypothetical protein
MAIFSTDGQFNCFEWQYSASTSNSMISNGNLQHQQATQCISQAIFRTDGQFNYFDWQYSALTGNSMIWKGNIPH